MTEQHVPPVRHLPRRHLTAAVCCLLAALPAYAEPAPQERFHDPEADAPYAVWDSKPALTMRPLILDPSGSSAVIEWMTDSDADGTVHWGEGSLDHVSVAQHDGLLDVGTLHRVVVEGLKPGHTYKYQVASRRVVALRPYWPERGSTVQSDPATFRTLDSAAKSVRFAVMTDTHEKVSRIGKLVARIDPGTVDFVVHNGDAVNYATSEQQIKDVFLAPMSSALKGTTPLIFARGNHEYRGPYARELGRYFKGPDETYDFSRDAGPVHFIVVDTGEDKPDETNVYAGLNDVKQYREREFQRFSHLLAEPGVAKASFRVILAHQKDFGWLDGHNDAWMSAANQAGVDLVIAGHEHRFEHIKPGLLYGNRFPILVVGQDQVARVEADAKALKVVVLAADGSTVDSFTLKPRQGGE